MSTKLIFFFSSFWLLLFSLLFGISTAQAQTPEPTATPYWQPLIQTSTPEPTFSVACPNGQPDGWGTVTPDTYWTMQCGNCVQAPTATTDPFIPTVAPTATVIPTATPETPYLFYKSIGVKLIFIVNQIQESGVGAEWIGYPQAPLSTFLDCGAGNYVKGAIAVVHTSSVGVASKIKVFGKMDQGWDEREGVVSMVDTLWVSGYRAALTAGSGLVANVELTEADLDQFSAWITGWVPSVLVREDSWIATEITYVGLLCHGFELPEIEPTPGPTQVSYCNQVDDGSGNADLGISLPEIVVSQPYCLQIGGQTLDLSVLNLIPGVDDIGDVGVPGFFLCYQYISFGHLDLFGLNVNLDILAMLMGGVALLRILLRS